MGELKTFKKADYGQIWFGQFKGKRWDELPNHYLEFLSSEECTIKNEYKEIAKKVLKQKRIIDGQIEMF